MMYAYFAKGMTVGHILTRRVLREITSIPGILLDIVFALFWIPDYTSYWDKNSATLSYADGTTHTGVMRCLFGWIGEILGFVIGAPIGALIGTAFYIPDLIIRGFLFLKEQLFTDVDDLAQLIGERNFYANLSVYSKPESYMQKAWNLGTATFGMALAAIPYTAAKILEFIIPFINISPLIAFFCGSVGGLLGWGLGGFLALPIFLLDKLTDLITLCRNGIRNAVALVYGKTDAQPIRSDDDECCGISHEAIHSKEFLNEVNYYHRTSWAQLIFGPLKSEEIQPIRVIKNTAFSEPIDACTHEPLGAKGVPTLIDPCGHTFNDDRYTEQRGIRFWIQSNHNCPLSRKYLTEQQLIPNHAFDELRLAGS